MIEMNDFIKNIEESDNRYICYNLNKSIRIFKYLIEDENLEDIQIYVSSKTMLELILNKITKYIQWFSSCETVLRYYYQNKLGEKVYDTWFDDIEIFRADVTFNSEDDYGATIYCGDTIFIDHTLEIEFERESITDIRLNG